MKCKEYGQNVLLLVAMMKEMCCKCDKAHVRSLYSCPNIDSEDCRNCIEAQREKIWNSPKKC